jgi:NAD-dependent DNA ligase (contains BRCT domain type II)|nr:MAG TPA: Chromatin remodeling complex ATPase [Caudoviricetes sp.]
MTVVYRPEQIQAVRQLQNGSILAGGVGSGKTLTSLAWYLTSVCNAASFKKGGSLAKKKVKGSPTLYVITTAKKRDSLEWEEEAARIGLSTDPACSFTGSSIVVDSWNNIGKYSDREHAVFFFDEQRASGSGRWVKEFLKITKKNTWLLLSATPGDVWMDYLPVFMAHGFFRTRTEFMEDHVIFDRFAKYPKVKRYIGEAKLQRLRRSILVEMPVERHTTRERETVYCDYDRDLYKWVVKNRMDPWTEEPLRDAGGVCRILRKVVSDNDWRSAEAKRILSSNERVIVFYNYNYELDRILAVAESLRLPTAQWNGHRHDAIPAESRWVYICQYTSAAEGWNCTSTDTVLFWSLNYSWRVTEQCEGRIDRLNTPYSRLKYYFLESHSSIDEAVRRSLSSKKVFNERAFVG